MEKGAPYNQQCNKMRFMWPHASTYAYSVVIRIEICMWSIYVITSAYSVAYYYRIFSRILVYMVPHITAYCRILLHTAYYRILPHITAQLSKCILIIILKSAYISPHKIPHMRPHTTYAVCGGLPHTAQKPHLVTLIISDDHIISEDYR